MGIRLLSSTLSFLHRKSNVKQTFVKGIFFWGRYFAIYNDNVPIKFACGRGGWGAHRSFKQAQDFTLDDGVLFASPERISHDFMG